MDSLGTEELDQSTAYLMRCMAPDQHGRFLQSDLLALPSAGLISVLGHVLNNLSGAGDAMTRRAEQTRAEVVASIIEASPKETTRMALAKLLLESGMSGPLRTDEMLCMSDQLLGLLLALWADAAAERCVVLMGEMPKTLMQAKQQNPHDRPPVSMSSTRYPP